MTTQEFVEKDTALRHAIQSGVAIEQAVGEDAVFYMHNLSLARIIKHIRTGLNCVMAEHVTIIKLLLDKGIITQEEYYDTEIEMLSKEVGRIQDSLRASGSPGIKLV